MRKAPANRVIVQAPARLHLGFLDLHGGLGRCFGSLGLTLEDVFARVAAESHPTMLAEGKEQARVQALLEALAALLPPGKGALVRVEQAIPAHAGLGSGTQLALAVGTAVARLHGLALEPRDLARVLDRGARSGIGVGAFERGGFLVDGGRGAGDGPAPIVSRLPFPAAWRAVLVFDREASGLHGHAEITAFQHLPQFPADIAAHLCRLVLMQALPAMAEADLPRFGEAITTLQQTIGDYFAPAQGGRYASPRVAEMLALFESEGVACIGQSSWGPTGFAIVESEEQAEELTRIAAGRAAPGLEFRVCAGRNHGADFRVEAALGRVADASR